MRKIRHPHQILEVSKMAVGHRYAFVVQFHKNSTPVVSEYMFGGVFNDSRAAASARGHDLDALPLHLGKLVYNLDDFVVTAHMDGWSGSRLRHRTNPILVYWSRLKPNGYDDLSTYFGPGISHTTCAIVPAERWTDDPHIVFGDNDMVERIAGQATESPAEWERVMRKRKHDAMAKAIGF